MYGIIIPEPYHPRSLAEMCDTARESVGLPPIDREWYIRWKRRLDCSSCPANPVCEHAAFMKSLGREIERDKQRDARVV